MPNSSKSSPVADLPLPFGVIFDPARGQVERFTHKDTGRTCLRQPYMTDVIWRGEVIKFFADVERGFVPVKREYGPGYMQGRGAS